MCFYPRVCAKVLYNLLVRLGDICCNYLACACRYTLPPPSSSSSVSNSSVTSGSNKEHIELNDNVYDYVVINMHHSSLFSPSHLSLTWKKRCLNYPDIFRVLCGLSRDV
ncbi:hypothetical protein ACFFRR_006536 [Megaselia abdita]